MNITSKPNRRPAKQAFTLLELLTVIAVMLLLTGLILRAAAHVQKRAAYSRAKTDLVAIAQALERYKTDYGHYPVSGGPCQGWNDCTAALGATLVNGPKRYYDGKNVQGNSIIDPWDMGYMYRYPVSGYDGSENISSQPGHTGAEMGTYRLYSRGPDRRPGTGDDIGITMTSSNYTGRTSFQLW
jgi:type II secretion system protein G